MKPANWLSVLAAGGLLLWLGLRMNGWLADEVVTARHNVRALERKLELLSADLEELRSLKEMKEREMAVITSGLNSTAQAKKGVYESGLALQEEKRVLEKLLEIMTTWIRVDYEAGQVSVMREDHSLNDFPLVFSSTHPITEQQKKSQGLRITSKERFAHPERGKAEEKDGVLTWVPPQVGQSTRSNALGEFVIFTNSNIIFHGPYLEVLEHNAYPHACIGLSLPDARKLYRSTFIGNRVAFSE